VYVRLKKSDVDDPATGDSGIGTAAVARVSRERLARADGERVGVTESLFLFVAGKLGLDGEVGKVGSRFCVAWVIEVDRLFCAVRR
jgi:hypothetical protein